MTRASSAALLTVLLTTVIAAPGAIAQDPSPPTPQPAAQPAPAAVPQAAPVPSCSTPEHRQFDFWEGSWTVRDRAQPDRPPATNRLTLAEGGCVLREEYANGPYSGTSLSFYDAGDDLWRQTWIDNQGQPLRLEGGWKDGAMVMEQRRDGTIDRITWTPLADGTVTQAWTRSTDGGGTWATVFDGLYEPAGGDGG